MEKWESAKVDAATLQRSVRFGEYATLAGTASTLDQRGH